MILEEERRKDEYMVQAKHLTASALVSLGAAFAMSRYLSSIVRLPVTSKRIQRTTSESDEILAELFSNMYSLSNYSVIGLVAPKGGLKSTFCLWNHSLVI